MYKALYSFSSKDSDISALNFRENDTFTVLDTKNPHWWLVQDGNGRVGYVPGNYLKKIQGHGLSDVLQSIDRAIAVIQRQGDTEGGGLNDRQAANIQKLQKHRENVIKEHNPKSSHSSMSEDVQPSRTAPAPPVSMVRDHDKKQPPSITRQESRSSKKNQAPTPPIRSPPVSKVKDTDQPFVAQLSAKNLYNKRDYDQVDMETRNQPDDMCTNCEPRSVLASPRSTSAPNAVGNAGGVSTNLPENLCVDLVMSVRSQTNLSYDMSRVAVVTVLSQLRDQLPSLQETMASILQSLAVNKTVENDDGNEDALKLRRHFQELTACKDDSQQRSWFLHEDEATITANLSGLLDIVEKANSDLCRRIAAEDNYEGVHNLALYYQMETRVTIRMLLLQVFGALCSLDVRIISELLSSVLPLELARDIQADTEDIKKLKYSAYVLTMLFSTGESIPVHHYDHLNQTFVGFLLDQVESCSANDWDEQIAELATQVILAYNLHFELPSDNLVMHVLAKQATANSFMEKLMLLLNREEDPVRILSHEPPPPNSVLKLFGDIYSSANTANLLYTNDCKVLIDIVLQRVTDRCPGDKLRTEFLSLLHLILKTCNYAEHEHRRRELTDSLRRISQEEQQHGVDTTMDKLIVRQIGKDLPQCFDIL